MLSMSRPAWARGLKLAARLAMDWLQVAPCVGAWIETKATSRYAVKMVSRPAWARGLKPSCASTRALVNEL